MKTENSITLDDINKLSPATQDELMDILERYKKGERLEAIKSFCNLFGVAKNASTLSSVTLRIQQLIKLFEA